MQQQNLPDIPYRPSDIQWVKSVKRDGGRGWAFFEDGTDRTFPLTFSDRQLNSARQIACGEIILLFQRVDNMEDVPKGTYLTHLVTPIGGVKENPHSPHRFKWEREVLVIARTSPYPAVTVSAKELNFGRVNFGRADDIGDLSKTKSRESIQELVWHLFRGHFSESLDDVVQHPGITGNDDDEGAWEGKESEAMKKHLQRERKPFIVNLAKSRALRNGNGRIFCECCDMDFLAEYGAIGSGFIECHHRQFLSVGGERKTYPEDLALVCANCHRMLHRRRPDGGYYSVEELKAIVARQRSGSIEKQPL